VLSTALDRFGAAYFAIVTDTAVGILFAYMTFVGQVFLFIVKEDMNVLG